MPARHLHSNIREALWSSLTLLTPTRGNLSRVDVDGQPFSQDNHGAHSSTREYRGTLTPEEKWGFTGETETTLLPRYAERYRRGSRG